MANTEPYPTRWNTIHFGIDADDLTDPIFLVFTDQMQLAGAFIFIDGDGWQTWRAEPGTADNDTTSMHVQMAVQTKADAANALTALRDSGITLAPPVHGNSVVMTDAEDWQEIFYAEAL